MRKKRPPTIETVALTAGVSAMTVSRVLREPARVADATRERVECAMERLGYVHNRLAGALASQHGAHVAVIVPSLQNIVYTEVLSGIANGLRDSGFQPVLGISDYEPQRELELLQSMLTWRPAGVILANIHHLPATTRLLERLEVPLVEMMELTRRPIDMSVGLDHAAAGRTMANHLLQAGYRRFAYLGSNHSVDKPAASRFQAFVRALRRKDIELRTSLTVPESSGISLGRNHAETLLKGKVKFDTLYCSNDAVAAGVMMYCLAEGIRVPEDLAIASFSGLEIAEAMPVPLTTVRSPRLEIGRLSAARILARLRNEAAPRVTNAGFELVPGHSA